MLIDSCITQLKAQGPSRTCNESKEEEEQVSDGGEGASERRRKREGEREGEDKHGALRSQPSPPNSDDGPLEHATDLISP